VTTAGTDPHTYYNLVLDGTTFASVAAEHGIEVSIVDPFQFHPIALPQDPGHSLFG
jgi:hypothetical protein